MPLAQPEGCEASVRPKDVARIVPAVVSQLDRYNFPLLIANFTFFILFRSQLFYGEGTKRIPRFAGEFS